MIDNIADLEAKASVRGKLNTLIDGYNELGPVVTLAANNASALLEAIEEATERAVPVYIDSDVLMGSTSIDIDVQRTCLLMQRGSLRWTSVPASGYGILLRSSVGKANNGTFEYYRRVRKWISGGALIGGSSIENNLDMDAIRIGEGDSIEGRVSLGSLSDVSIQGFSKLLAFKDRSWSIGFDGCKFSWGKITSPLSVSDFGERMNFSNCFIHDSVTLELNKGDWYLDRCSIDNALIDISSDAQVFLNQTHLERPGSLGPETLYGRLNSSTSTLLIRDFEIVQNEAVMNDAMFEVHPTNVNAGLILDGISVVLNVPYCNPNDPAATNDHRILVKSGSGRVQASKINIRATENSAALLIADSLQVLTNPGFEGSTLAPWTVSGTGTVTQDSEARTTRRIAQGVKSLKIVATTGQTSTVSQSVPAKAGQYAALGMWLKTNFTSGTGEYTIKITAIDGQGNSLGVSQGHTETSNIWKGASVQIVCPPSTQAVKTEISLNGYSGSVSLLVDDLLENII